MAFPSPFQTPGPSFSTTPATTPGLGLSGTPFNDHNSPGRTWPPASTTVETSCHPSTSSTHVPGRPKAYRYSAFTPAQSSPLARVSQEYSMEDDDDNYQPSSPLGRISNFSFGSNVSPTRRSDENESPLMQRRRAQYKSRGSIGSSGGMFRKTSGALATPPSGSRSFSTSGAISAPLFAPQTTPDDTRRAVVRERFKQRCFERAAKARAKAVKAKRRLFDDGEDEGCNPFFSNSSPGVKGKDKDEGMDEMDESDEEGEEDIINDELFRRIMVNMNRRLQHSYRVSYQNEVGSSFDPDMEDVAQWEEELQAPVEAPQPPLVAGGPVSNAIHDAEPIPEDVEEEFDPAEWEDGELDAYADEYARLMEEEAHQQEQQQSQPTPVDPLLAGLENLPEEELFGVWNFDSEDADMQM